MLDTIVIRSEPGFDLLQLHPASVREIIEDLAHEGVPISDCAQHTSRMDVIELVFEGPRRTHVVDYEPTVGRDDGWLNQGQICAQHVAVRVLVRAK